MAGVGRIGDFGKPEYTDEEMETRLDVVDPFLTYEENVERLVACGLSREKAKECVNMVLIGAKKSKAIRADILREQSEFRKEMGDIKECKPDDESCSTGGPEDEKKLKKE